MRAGSLTWYQRAGILAYQGVRKVHFVLVNVRILDHFKQLSLVFSFNRICLQFRAFFVIKFDISIRRLNEMPYLIILELSVAHVSLAGRAQFAFQFYGRTGEKK